MGMYTELNIQCRLDKMDDDSANVLKYMLGWDIPYERIEDTLGKLYEKFALFRTSDRWKFMLRSDSCYFDHFADSELQIDNIRDCYFLNVRCDLKNYCNEIQYFLEWIFSMSSTKDFVGYMRFEISSLPTLIFFDENKVRYQEVQ